MQEVQLVLEGDVQVAQPDEQATQSVLFVVELRRGKYPTGREGRQVLFRK